MSKNFSNLLGGAIINKSIDESSIRERILIREDFKALIPPLSDDEINQLEANILAEGIRDPLIIWPVGSDFILIDGHNRFSICQKHNLTFPFKKVAFKDDEEVKGWMIKNQLGRRNLSPEQQSYLRGLRYNNEKSQGKRTDLTLDQNDPKSQMESTAAALANEYNVSEATIKRDGEFAVGVDLLSKENPALKEEILKGKVKVSKQEIRALGKGKSKAKAGEHVNKKISAVEVARIAFEYLQKESRSISEVCNAIGLDGIDNPIEFFLKWNMLNNDPQNND